MNEVKVTVCAPGYAIGYVPQGMDFMKQPNAVECFHAGWNSPHTKKGKKNG